MTTLPFVPVILVAIAVIFVAMALRQYLKSEGKLTPAIKTWLRVAIIFSIVAIGVYLMNTYFS